jgi:4-hydroxy-tetrahydrodipicolinate synthase
MPSSADYSGPPPDGIIAVPATPFTADNRVDVESLRRYARHALRAGAVGFLAPAVAGEVETLSNEDRACVVATLLEEAQGRVPVIGGATDPDPTARLQHARRFLSMGCHGVLVYLPYDHDDAVAAAVHALAALRPPLLMIQDLDSAQGSLPVPLIARLHREVPCFNWIKVETADRCQKISAILEATGGTLRVGTAGPDMIELLDRGVHSFLVTFSLSVYAQIWSFHRTAQRERAASLYRRLLPCLAFMATHQRIQWRFTKALLQAEKLFTTTRVRRPVPELDAIETRLVSELAEYARSLGDEVRAKPGTSRNGATHPTAAAREGL